MGICFDNTECHGDLICGNDNICQSPCSHSQCDIGEGECYNNDQCTDTSICGNNMLCRSMNIFTNVSLK